MKRAKKRKGIEALDEISNPIPGNEGTHRGRRNEWKTERNGERVPNPATLDHLVASYDVQGSYGKPIRFIHMGYLTFYYQKY